MPELDELLVQKLVEDVAQKIHEPATVAKRYGFSSAQHMVNWLKTHPEVCRRIKARRAVWESDSGLEERLRTYAGHAALEALPSTGHMAIDKQVPAATRLDALKALSRMAGVDGIPAGAKGAPGGTGGNFVINFSFAGGKASFSGTTVVAETVPDAPDASAT